MADVSPNAAEVPPTSAPTPSIGGRTVKTKKARRKGGGSRPQSASPQGHRDGTPRRSTVLAGLLLLLVPTVWTVFTKELGGVALWIRLAVIVVWLGVATAVIRNTERQSEQIGALMGEPLGRLQKQRIHAGSYLLRTVLPPQSGPLHSYDFRLYMFDDHLQKLVPYWKPENVAQSDSYDVGEGATGKAWERADYVIVRGAGCSDGTYHLSPEKQAKNRHLKVVAAMPVRSARNEVFAILTASGTVDDGFLASPEGYEAHSELAEAVGRVLVDILKMVRD